MAKLIFYEKYISSKNLSEIKHNSPKFNLECNISFNIKVL